MAVIDFSLILTAVNNTTTALRGAYQGVERLGTVARATEVRLRAIQVVFAGIASAKAIQFTQAFVNTAATLEEMQMRTALLTGSWASAGDVIERIGKNFSGTTASSEDLVKSFQTLAGVGLPVEEAERLNNAIGMVAIASGRTQDSISSTSLAFAKLLEKGEVDIRTLVAQMAQSMPQAVSIMAAQSGKSITQFVADVKSGAVTAQEVMKLFVRGAEANFSSLMDTQRGMLTGALSLIRNAWKDAVEDLSKRTPINSELASRLRTLRGAIDAFVASIDTNTVHQFFTILDSVSAAAYNVAISMAPLGSIILTFGMAIASFINSLPTEVISAGLIGYIVGGRRGLLVFGTAVAIVHYFFGSTEEKMSAFVRTATELMPLGVVGLLVGGAKGAAIVIGTLTLVDRALVGWGAALEHMFNSQDRLFRDMWNDGSTVAKGLYDTFFKGATDVENKNVEAARKSSEAYKKVLSDIDNVAKATSRANTGDIRNTPQYQQQLAAAWAAVASKIEIAKDTLDQYEAKINGDTLGGALAQMNKRYDQQVRALQEALKLANEFNNKYKTGGDLVLMINGQLERARVLREKEIQDIQQTNALLQDKLRLEQEGLRLRADQSILTARTEYDNSFFGNLARGMGGAELERAAQTRLQLSSQIIDAELQINNLMKERRTVESDPVAVANIDATIQKYRELIGVTNNALQNISAQASLANQMMQSIGNTITDGISSALQGWAMRMNNIRDVGIQMYQSITKAAADYIAKLLLINAMQMFFGGPSIGPSAAFVGNPGTGMGIYGNGGAFNGKVVPFANGGIIGGPTLFGLAGEAGEEAIMPLTRIGGKLGVHAAGGGGGDTFNVHLNALDTRTGVEFLMKHADKIGSALAQRDRLNRGTRKV